jgi:hypothetical protein
MKTFKNNQLCLLLSVHTLVGNTMLKICAPLAIENLEEINILPIVNILIDYFIQWVCARHAIYLIIIKEELSLKEKIFKK